MNADIIIIGAGASGLMAAIAAARQLQGQEQHTTARVKAASAADASGSQKILILEHMDKPGKKILATGNGRCNFTNSHMDASCYHSDTPELYEKIFRQFGHDETMAFFKSLGIYPKDRDGYMYPASGQASAVLDVLMMELKRYPVRILYDSHVEAIHRQKSNFEIITRSNERHKAKKLILACGGQAYPKLGSDGSGYGLAKALGLEVTPVVPALTGLYAIEKYFKAVSGVRVEGSIRIMAERKGGEPALLAQDRGELQLTDYGVSGIPAFQVSRFAAQALLKRQLVVGIVDFMPDMAQTELFLYLAERADAMPHKNVDDFLIGMFNQKLCRLLNESAGLDGKQSVARLNRKQLGTLAQKIKNMTFHVAKTGDFTNAQVCAGGVSGRELTEHLEARKVPGLYIAGELVDVDGICGGYNLQWAWSSGYVAGTYAGKECL